MEVKDNAYVTISYTLTDDNGEVVDKSDRENPLEFVFGKGQILPGLEKELEGMSPNESKKVALSAEEGYGPPNEELYQEIPRENFPSSEVLEAGQQFQANTPHGPMRFVIHEVKDDSIIVDLNHPLAGLSLNFDVEVTGVRQATAEELTPQQHHHCGDGSQGCSGCGQG